MLIHIESIDRTYKTKRAAIEDIEKLTAYIAENASDEGIKQAALVATEIAQGVIIACMTKQQRLNAATDAVMHLMNH